MRTLAALLLLASSAWAAETLSPRLNAAEGETCIVCDRAVSSRDAAYRCDGQRVAMHAAGCCEGEFLKDPSRYVANLQPRNMIFDARAPFGLAGAWIWVGVFALVGIVCGGFCAQLAIHKGHSPLKAFLLGLFFSVPAWAYLATRPRAPGSTRAPEGLRKVPLTSEPVRCPSCGEANHPLARQCSACGASLSPAAPSEAEAWRAVR